MCCKFLFKKVDKTQSHYSTTDKELYAAVQSILHYKHYLYGAKFTLKTDHKAIAYLWKSQNLNSRLTRWSLLMQEYTFDVEYIKGEKNGADYFSRIYQLSEKYNKKYSADEIKQIIQDYHITTGHSSIQTMIYNIKKKYKWQNMNKDIVRFVQNCITCLRSGYKITQTKNNIITADRPNQL